MDKESSMVKWLKKQKKADLVRIAYELHLRNLENKGGV
jgi:hypothetical protein